MRSQIIEAPSEKLPIYKDELFLGGGISGCIDWQTEFLKHFTEYELTIYNPRRSAFDLSDPKESEIQIAWEYERLRSSKFIVFWFPHETLCPITLLELGAALERHWHRLIIGCHPDYKRKFDVAIQTHLSSPTSEPVYDSIDSVIKRTKELLHHTYEARTQAKELLQKIFAN